MLENARLYLILDTQVNPYEELWSIAVRAVGAGADIVQLRDKGGDVRAMLDFSRRVMRLVQDRALFIVNDRLDVALAAGASGVHLGQEDLPVAEARRLSEGMVIGCSCQEVEHVRRACEDGADYIGFGSVFKTRTKPDREPMDLELLKAAAEHSRVPLFAIGGIRLDNVDAVQRAGVQRVAVCRDICQSEDVEGRVAAFEEKLCARVVQW